MDAFISHVKEIKEKGFDTILFCISHTDLLYNLEIHQEFREYAESEGLVTWATFWGFTAGESIIKIADNPLALLDEWIAKVGGIGFKNLLLDEPKGKDILEVVSYFSKTYTEISFHICLSDDTFNKMPDEEITKMPVKSFGLSCYHLGHNDWLKVTNRTIEWCSRLKMLRPEDNFIFIQGFDISEGMEDLPMIVKDIASAYGIVDFAFWSFKSTAATGTKRPKNHKEIWGKIKF